MTIANLASNKILYFDNVNVAAASSTGLTHNYVQTLNPERSFINTGTYLRATLFQQRLFPTGIQYDARVSPSGDILGISACGVSFVRANHIGQQISYEQGCYWGGPNAAEGLLDVSFNVTQRNGSIRIKPSNFDIPLDGNSLASIGKHIMCVTATASRYVTPSNLASVFKDVDVTAASIDNNITVAITKFLSSNSVQDEILQNLLYFNGSMRKNIEVPSGSFNLAGSERLTLAMRLRNIDLDIMTSVRVPPTMMPTPSGFEWPSVAMNKTKDIIEINSGLNALLYGNGEYRVIASSDRPGEEAWAAFNKNYAQSSNAGGSFWWTSAAGAYDTLTGYYKAQGQTLTTLDNGMPIPGEFLEIKLPGPVTVTSFQMYPRNSTSNAILARNPASFILCGSNDGISFSALGVLETNITSWAANIPLTRTVANATAYMYYRICVYQVQPSADCASIGELYLFSSDAPRAISRRFRIDSIPLMINLEDDNNSYRYFTTRDFPNDSKLGFTWVDAAPRPFGLALAGRSRDYVSVYDSESKRILDIPKDNTVFALTGGSFDMQKLYRVVNQGTSAYGVYSTNYEQDTDSSLFPDIEAFANGWSLVTFYYVNTATSSYPCKLLDMKTGRTIVTYPKTPATGAVAFTMIKDNGDVFTTRVLTDIGGKIGNVDAGLYAGIATDSTKQFCHACISVGRNATLTGTGGAVIARFPAAITNPTIKDMRLLIRFDTELNVIWSMIMQPYIMNPTQAPNGGIYIGTRIENSLGTIYSSNGSVLANLPPVGTNKNTHHVVHINSTGQVQWYTQMGYGGPVDDTLESMLHDVEGTADGGVVAVLKSKPNVPMFIYSASGKEQSPLMKPADASGNDMVNIIKFTSAGNVAWVSYQYTDTIGREMYTDVAASVMPSYDIMSRRYSLALPDGGFVFTSFTYSYVYTDANGILDMKQAHTKTSFLSPNGAIQDVPNIPSFVNQEVNLALGNANIVTSHIARYDENGSLVWVSIVKSGDVKTEEIDITTGTYIALLPSMDNDIVALNAYSGFRMIDAKNRFIENNMQNGQLLSISMEGDIRTTVNYFSNANAATVANDQVVVQAAGNTYVYWTTGKGFTSFPCPPPITRNLAIYVPTNMAVEVLDAYGNVTKAINGPYLSQPGEEYEWNAERFVVLPRKSAYTFSTSAIEIPRIATWSSALDASAKWIWNHPNAGNSIVPAGRVGFQTVFQHQGSTVSSMTLSLLADDGVVKVSVNNVDVYAGSRTVAGYQSIGSPTSITILPLPRVVPGPNLLYIEAINRVTYPTYNPAYVLPTSGLGLWLDATDITSLTITASNTVAEWRDKSGNGRHFAQTTSTRQPPYETNTMNGLPSIKISDTIGSFTANKPLIRNANVMGTLASSTSMTFFAVTECATLPFCVVMKNSTNASDGADITRFQIRLNDQGSTGANSVNVPTVFVNAQQFTGPHAVAGLRYVHAVSIGGSGVLSYSTFNGVETVFTPTTNMPSSVGSATSVFSIGDLNVNATNNAAQSIARISELIMYDRALTASERKSVENHLMAKYNIMPDLKGSTAGLAFTVTNQQGAVVASSSSVGTKVSMSTLAENREISNVSTNIDGSKFLNTFFLDPSGALYTSGDDEYTRSFSMSPALPTRVPNTAATLRSLYGKVVSQASTHSFNAAAVDSVGIVHVFGRSAPNRSPLPINTGSLTGEFVVKIDQVRYIAPLIALDAKGKVHVWAGWFPGFNPGGSETALDPQSPITTDISGNNVFSTNIPLLVTGKGSLTANTVAVDIAASSSALFVVDASGNVHTWGSQTLFFGAAAGSPYVFGMNYPPVKVAVPMIMNTPTYGTSSLTGRKAVRVFKRYHGAYVIDSDGLLHGWGENSYGFDVPGFGSVGCNVTASSAVPLPVCISDFGSLRFKKVVQVAAGGHCAIALDNAGDLHTWGNMLGDATMNTSAIPVRMSYKVGDFKLATLPFTAVSATQNALYAIDSDRNVFGWGGLYLTNRITSSPAFIGNIGYSHISRSLDQHTYIALDVDSTNKRSYNASRKVQAWADIGSLRNDLTIFNGVQTSDGISFDGFSTFAVSNGAILKSFNTTAFTTVVWAYINKNTMMTFNSPLLHIGQTSASVANTFFLDTQRVGDYSVTMPNLLLQSSEQINQPGWYMITFVKDGSNCSLYLNNKRNGQIVTQENATYAPSGFTIGRNYDKTRFFSGIMRKVSMYNVALKPHEIAKLYYDNPMPSTATLIYRMPSIPLTSKNDWVDFEFGSGTYQVSSSSSSPTDPDWSAFNYVSDLVTTGNYWTSSSDANRCYTATATTVNGVLVPAGAYLPNSISSTIVDGVQRKGEWLQVSLPNAIVPDRIHLWSRVEAIVAGRHPRSFIIAGSNDNTTWTTVYNEPARTSWEANVPYVATISNVASIAPYQHYRLCVLEVQTVAGYYPPAAMTASNVIFSTEAYGNGLYKALASSEVVTEPAWGAFNRQWNNNSGPHFWTSGQAYTTASGTYTGTITTKINGIDCSGEWIQIELPYAISMGKMEIFPRPGTSTIQRSPTSFVLAGSNDGTNFTQFVSVSGTAWSWSTAYTTDLGNNTVPYKFYRMCISKIGLGQDRASVGDIIMYSNDITPMTTHLMEMALYTYTKP